MRHTEKNMIDLIREFLKNAAPIIEAASKSQLGIFALMILALSLITLIFFWKASTKVKVIIFIFLFIGVVLFGYALTQVDGGMQAIPLEEGYDFILKSPNANWSNGSQTLNFPGKRGDSQGFVYYGSYEKLENNETSKSFLEMHPQWESHGSIKGKYGVFKISPKLKMLCQVGFLWGAQGSDGVKFRIEFENQTDADRQVLYEQFSRYDGQLDGFTVDLTQIANKKGYIILSVGALESSGQDWAIWNKAIVIRE